MLKLGGRSFALLCNATEECAYAALAATAQDLAGEVLDEVQRFFLLGIDKSTKAGLSRNSALQVLATLEGAMLTANVLENPSLFDDGTAALASPVGSFAEDRHFLIPYDQAMGLPWMPQ
ncbi:hypothetical protein [Rhizobium sp. BR 317]|uniref:hypothetical protein n=1 Tax=Rhizobium sp. BR 317 TaxID=3040015 RepID=UPI0039BEE757